MHGSDQQLTLASPALIEGVALFTGTPSRCTIHPAPINHGLVFEHNGTRIPLGAGSLCDAPVHPVFASVPPRCSAVTNGGSSVWLVEHVLSALAGLGITNAVVSVDHHELPIMDGSSQAFVRAILDAGITEQDAAVVPIELPKTVRVEHGDSWIEAIPSDAPSYEYTIDYGSDSPIKRAAVEWDGDSSDYAHRVAPARTFCLKQEAEMLIAGGLFKHLAPGDMLVLDSDGPMDNELRDPDECAHHKLLDLIGDVALFGSRINARFVAHKSGHSMAHALVRAIAITVD